MSWSWNKCLEGGEKGATKGAGYGAAGGAAVAAATGGAGAPAVAAGADLGAKVGGAYGCLRANGIKDLQDLGEFAQRNWGRERRRARRVWDRVFGKRRKHKRAPLPTMDQATVYMIEHLAKRRGSPTGQPPYHFELPYHRGDDWTKVPARWVLHPANIATLFGDEAGGWDAERLYHHIATMWGKTPENWDPGVRFAVTIRRVGDFLVEARSGEVIEGWPLTPPTTTTPAAPSDLRAKLIDELNDDVKESIEKKNNLGPGFRLGAGLTTASTLARKGYDFLTKRGEEAA